MFWTVIGSNTILALRCSHLNGAFEDYWHGTAGGLISTAMSRTPIFSGCAPSSSRIPWKTGNGCRASRISAEIFASHLTDPARQRKA